MATFSFEFVVSFFVALNSAIYLCYTVSSCIFILAFANDMKTRLHELKETKLMENNLKLIKKTYQIIELHSMAKKLL